MYNGEFYPNEMIVSGDPDYVSVSHQVSEKASICQMNDEDKLMDLMGETEHMNGYAKRK